jgi:hypothetical protein
MHSDVNVQATLLPIVPVFTAPLTNIVTATSFFISGDVLGLWQLSYEWRKDGVPIPGQSGPFPRGQRYQELYFDTVDPSLSGTYSLTVKNDFGSVTSSAKIEVRSLLCSEVGGNPILTNHVSFTNSFSFQLDTPFQRAHIYYTLDGTEPNFSSLEYSHAVTLTETADLQAIVYSSDFTTSTLIDPIHFEKASTVNFYYQIVGHGTIEGQVSNVPKGSKVTLRAVPDPGSVFVYWDLRSQIEDPEITIQGDTDTSVKATFATPLSVKVSGQGTVEIEPDSPAYAPGLTLSLYPKPDSRSYFVRWSSGESSVPLQLGSGYGEPPTALFAPLPSGKASLIVVSKGFGFITGITTNVFAVGTSVNLEAKPFDNGTFLRWSGDVSSTNPSLKVDLETSKIIYAEFENKPTLRYNIFNSNVFVFDADGVGSIIELYSSSDLKEWHQETSRTNFSGILSKDWAPEGPSRFFKAQRRGR